MSFLISLLICLVLWIAISCQLTVSINSVPQVEIDALYSLYNATGGASWTWGYTSITYENRNLTGMPWNFSTLNPNPCQSSPNSWEGINCFCADNETNATCHVTVIALGGHNLKGTLPAEIANLSYLEVFEVPVNLITSSLPDSWRQLKNMTVLSLGTNQLQFTVPDWIGELSSLRLLDMTFNNFTGSLPPSLFELSNIKYLLLSHNNLTGILPSQFSGWNQLENLSLTNNYFIGEIPPQICSLPHLQSVEISDNDFSSTIPSCIGNVFALTSLNMNGNQLSGTLPHSITNLTKLQHLNLQLNNLNGSIPQEIGRLSHLRTLVLQFNALTGTIPPQIVNCTELIILDLSRNLLWGTIPEGIRDLRKLVELYVGVMLLDGNITDRLPTSSLRSLVVRNNLFSGPFSSFNAMDPLTYLSGQSNIFSGSFPNEVFFMSAINTVILSENSFTGQLPAVIPHNSTMLSLATDSNALSGVLPCANDSYPIPLYDYFMNDNFFSGTLCSNIGTFSNLYHLDVSYNILSGTISKEISSLGNLYELFLSNNQFSGSLDGVLDSSRQHQLVLLDVSTNYFTSTLPGEIFRLPHLIFFSASTNCFEGTLPSTICGAVNMTSLVMDGLSAATRCRDRFFPWSSVLDGFQVLHHVHGQLPSCVFSWPHVTLLHIAGNGLTGTLPNFASLPHLLVNLSLAHNHLSGDIPSVFQHHSFFDIDLSYNRLGGMLDHDFAVPPPNGSIALHSNHLSGHVPSTLLDSINIQLLDGNLFSCRVDRTDLPAHDPKSDSYACGSDSMNYSLFAWLLEVIVLVGLALCFVYKLSNDSDEAFQKTLLFVVERFQNLIAVRSLRPKSLEKCEPNPIDDNNNRDDDLKDSPSSGKLGIKHQMSPMESLVSMWTLTLTVQSTSTAETCLSNFAAMHSFIRTVFLLLTLVSLLLLMPINVILNRFFGIYTESYAWTLSSTLVAGSAPAWLLVVLLGCVFCVTGILVRNFVRSSGERLEELGLGMMRRGRLALIFLVNGLAMLLLDGAYIYVVMTSNAGVTLAMEIATAVLKLMWNEVVLWYFIPLSTKVIELSKTRTSSTLSISSHDNRLPSLHSIHSSIQRTIRSHQYDEYEVRALGLIVTANSIIIPAIAIACLSSSCYYRALFAAEPVTATTFIPDCALYLSSPNGQKCANFVLTTTDTTYDPPFFYDYECSSTIVNSYCAVFVFTCLSMMASCAMDLLGHYLHCTLPVEHRWRWVLKWWSTRVRIPLNANCTPPSGTHLLGLNRLVLRFCSLLCIALTCGLVFPPLALIVFITVVCITYSEQFFAGRLIEAAERLQLQGVLDDISLEIKPMFRLFFAAARPSFLISLLCVAMILFDIAGASSGWVMGLAAALSFIALFFVSNMAEIVWTNRDAYSPSLWLKRFSFDAKDVELDSEMELAKNPIHRSRADPDTPCS